MFLLHYNITRSSSDGLHRQCQTNGRQELASSMQIGTDIVEAWQEGGPADATASIRVWSWLDRFGAGMSLTCALHCLAIPVVLLLMPGLRAGLGEFTPADSWARWLLWSHEVEWLMAAIVIAFAGVVLGRGWTVHRQTKAIRWYVAGSLVLLAATLEWIALGLAHGVLLAVGGALIAWSHWSNLRLLRSISGRCRVALNRPPVNGRL